MHLLNAIPAILSVLILAFIVVAIVTYFMKTRNEIKKEEVNKPIDQPKPSESFSGDALTNDSPIWDRGNTPVFNHVDESPHVDLSDLQPYHDAFGKADKETLAENKTPDNSKSPSNDTNNLTFLLMNIFADYWDKHSVWDKENFQESVSSNIVDYFKEEISKIGIDKRFEFEYRVDIKVNDDLYIINLGIEAFQPGKSHSSNHLISVTIDPYSPSTLVTSAETNRRYRDSIATSDLKNPPPHQTKLTVEVDNRRINKYVCPTDLEKDSTPPVDSGANDTCFKLEEPARSDPSPTTTSIDASDNSSSSND